MAGREAVGGGDVGDRIGEAALRLGCLGAVSRGVDELLELAEQHREVVAHVVQAPLGPVERDRHGKGGAVLPTPLVGPLAARRAAVEPGPAVAELGDRGVAPAARRRPHVGPGALPQVIHHVTKRMGAR